MAHIRSNSKRKNRFHTAVFSLTGFLLVCAMQFSGAARAAELRPPAVPLVTHDPYFSIWSPADRLTDTDTVHWTLKRQALGSLIRIDDTLMRVMGSEPKSAEPLPQVDLQVLPTCTIYRFEDKRVALTLTFLTPALPSDLDVLARPLSYVTWEARSLDGKPHRVQLYFDCSAEVAVNQPEQKVVWDRPEIKGLDVLRVGSLDQPVLAKSGDDLRIDWGYCYLASDASQKARLVLGDSAAVREEFVKSGKLPAKDSDRKPREVKDGFPVMAAAYDLGTVTDKPASRHLMLAYDDLYSIKYFREKLRPYWRRNGAEARDLLLSGMQDYEALNRKCGQFDEQFMKDLTQVAGRKYALLCALTYRQTWAGNKIAADSKGMPLVFPKENFSNGCIATVDILFPQAPFFLTLSPTLTKGMLIPIFDYSASPRWKFAYAPHDLGTYPFATGQVYGGGELTDENQMPVEESGNMLIIAAALSRVEGNVQWVERYWPLLTKWADYCVKEGLDPAKQLCSADMFGHLPRNANLAVKAIIGIGGYAQLCDLAGKKDEAKRYRDIARDYVVKWQELSKDDGHSSLAYGSTGSWGMKHNLIWDRVLGLNLFPEAVGDAEIAWYLKVQKKYGLPCDNRTPTCLIDWALWSIALARDENDFQKLFEPIFNYANETSSRVPLSDWFNAETGKMQGMQARPVVGGLMMKVLADRKAWKRWAKDAQNLKGDWAPAKISIATKEIVPTAQAQPVTWRYTFEKPADNWMQADFDDSSWKEGPAGFGTKDTPGAVVRTEWNTPDIWIRRPFELSDLQTKSKWVLRMHYDEDPDVYLNGVGAADLKGWTSHYQEEDILPKALEALKAGRNVFAIHARQTYGGQYLDAGIVE
jgi:hypothetical protein